MLKKERDNRRKIKPFASKLNLQGDDEMNAYTGCTQAVCSPKNHSSPETIQLDSCKKKDGKAPTAKREPENQRQQAAIPVRGLLSQHKLRRGPQVLGYTLEPLQLTFPGSGT